MRDLRETANKAEELLRAAGVEKYALQVKETEKRELNTELETFSLFRTIFGGSAAVTVFMGGKKGTAAGNDLSDEGLSKEIRAKRRRRKALRKRTWKGSMTG